MLRELEEILINFHKVIDEAGITTEKRDKYAELYAWTLALILHHFSGFEVLVGYDYPDIKVTIIRLRSADVPALDLNIFNDNCVLVEEAWNGIESDVFVAMNSEDDLLENITFVKEQFSTPNKKPPWTVIRLFEKIYENFVDKHQWRSK